MLRDCGVSWVFHYTFGKHFCRTVFQNSNFMATRSINSAGLLVMLILRTIKTIANGYKSTDYNLDVIRQTTVDKFLSLFD